MISPLRTRFADLGRWPAILILACTAAAIGWGLFVSLRTKPAGIASVKEGKTDWDFYHGVIERVRAGQSYYDAHTVMFRQFEFAPYSVFNYRTPVYAWVISALPGEEWAHALLAGLAVLTMMLAFLALRREVGGWMAAAGMFLLLGGLGWCFIALGVYAQELWAGTLISMSIFLYVLGRWPLAVLAGLLALFFRELTLPYCFLALGFAVWLRRPAEVIAWIGGFALYGAFMAWHIAQVAPLVPNASGSTVLVWLVFGGTRFLLDTARMNFALLVFLPTWAAAVYLPVAALGLAGWRGETGARVGLTVAAYLAAFSIVGQPFNLYWGLIYAPLLSLGLLWTPLAMRDLWQAAKVGEASVKRH